MEIIIIIILILLNGLFSLAEMSLVSSRKFKLDNAIKRGSGNAKVALELSQNPTKMLSTVQIGITIIGLLLGIYGGQDLARIFEEWLKQYPTLSQYAHSISVFIIVCIITFFSILFGELLPKRIALTYAEPIAIFLARPMKWISSMTKPFVWTLSTANDFILKILNIDTSGEGKITEEEIKSMIQESTEGGEIREIEQDIVERVFEMGDRTVNSLMTHRSDIVWLDIADSDEDINQKVEEETHSAYPLCDSDIDNIKGIILLKDLYLNKYNKAIKLSAIAKKPLLIAENTSAYIVLEKFKKEKFHYGIVIDEYGSTIGFLTMDDLLDALLGDVSEDHHNEYSIKQKDENTWIIDGQYSIFEFIKYFSLPEIEEEEFDFNTVGGLFYFKMNEIPKLGDSLIHHGYSLEIIKMDNNRIDTILCKRK